MTILNLYLVKASLITCKQNGFNIFVIAIRLNCIAMFPSKNDYHILYAVEATAFVQTMLLALVSVKIPCTQPTYIIVHACWPSFYKIVDSQRKPLTISFTKYWISKFLWPDRTGFIAFGAAAQNRDVKSLFKPAKLGSWGNNFRVLAGKAVDERAGMIADLTCHPQAIVHSNVSQWQGDPGVCLW